MLSTFSAVKTQPVHAQSLSLSISPPLLEILIKPGKSITQAFTIINNGDPVIITPRILPLNENGIDESIGFVPESWITTANTDILFDRPIFLNTGEKRQLVLKVNPPPTTLEQDYYRVITLTTKPNPQGETTQTALSQNLGTPLLISVTNSGFLPKSAQIAKFELPTIIDSFGPLTSTIEVKNTGNTYFRPIGKILLTGIIGRGSYDLMPDVILAGSTRLITTEFSKSTQGDKTIELTGIFLGKYTLETDFTLDEGNIQITQKKTLYALPWKLGITVVIMLIGISFIKRHNRKKSTQ